MINIDKRNFIILTLFMVILVFLIPHNNNIADEDVRTDTVTQKDTVIIPNPVRDTAYVDHYIKIKEPVIETDTIDSVVYVSTELPIERKVYKDSLYEVQISGFQPNLDTIKVFPITTTIYQKEMVKIPQKRFSWGIQTGFGYGFFNKKPDFYVGIGCQLKL